MILLVSEARLSDIREYPRPRAVDILESRTPRLIKPLTRAYHWSIRPAMRLYVYPMLLTTLYESIKRASLPHTLAL